MKKSGTLSGAIVFASALVLVVFSPTASAGGSCWQRVIDDWADNSRVDGRYPIHCYQEALDNLPEDMRAYSSAPDDIARAMREELRRQAAALARESDGDPDASPSPPSSGGAAPKPPSGDSGRGRRTDSGQRPQDAFTREPDPGGAQDRSGGILVQALDEIGPRDADSFPLPLLILGGLAGLLLVLGGIAFVARRGPGRLLRLGRQ